MMSGCDGGGKEGGKKESEISPPPSPPPLPRGFRFIPTDEDAIYYLAKKINGGVLEKVVPIQEKNIYGEIPPWDLFSDLMVSRLKDDERFVFTPITPFGTRTERTVGNQGTWKNQSGQKTVFDVNSLCGTKRNFAYSKKQDGDESSWIMDEYTLIHEDQHNIAFCRIRYRKRDRSQSKRSAAVAAQVEATKRNKGSETETDLAVPADDDAAMGKKLSEMDLKSPLVDADTADEDQEDDSSPSDEEEDDEY